MGGAVALQLALDQPALATRLVIANSVPTFRPRTAREHFEIGYRLAAMAILGPARLGEIGAARMFPHPHQAALRARSAERGARNARRPYLAALWHLARWSVIDRLGEIAVPVLVLAAEHDYFAHEDTVRFAYALPRRRLHVFPGTRHGLPQEAPEAFNAAVLRFLHKDEP
jgi:3-oxoadipate enol-lactonase